MLLMVAAKVLAALLMLKVETPGQAPLVVGLYIPAINPVKSDPEGLVTPFKVTELPSLLVNIADPVGESQVVLTIELAVRVTAAGLARV